MKNLRVARRYAGALMAAAGARGTIDETARDLESVASVLRGSRELRLLMQSPVVRPSRKAAVMRAVFEGRTAAGTLEFIDLVIEKQREAHLAEIIEQFGLLRDEAQGIVNVDVTSAAGITGSQQDDLGRALERSTKKKIRIRTSVDPAIKAGLIVRIGDTVLDASLRRQLEILKARFLDGPTSAR